MLSVWERRLGPGIRVIDAGFVGYLVFIVIPYSAKS
jgi:hypothetical protein